MRFRDAEVEEEEKKEVAKDATVGGNNHKTSFGQFLSDQMSKGKVYSHECVIIQFFYGQNSLFTFLYIISIIFQIQRIKFQSMKKETLGDPCLL